MDGTILKKKKKKKFFPKMRSAIISSLHHRFVLKHFFSHKFYSNYQLHDVNLGCNIIMIALMVAAFLEKLAYLCLGMADRRECCEEIQC